ncbi:unnamed protein product [Cuscuta epithymum]|uniref:F-box domain-containing protein n=1 Tax=Cuscuta epithymum TaxID=186058 RepID=A0AAV0DPR7_9ASTE|nr:unnamed protein product [Cuscuta epithymum]
MDLPKTKKRRSTRLLLKHEKKVAEGEPKTTFVCLPPEIIKHILSRLPNVKSILQSMSVCRSWELCARDPYDIQLHFSQSSVTQSKLLYLYSSFKNELHSVDFSDINEKGLIGFHPVTKDYKAFCIPITSNRDDSRSRAYVYSLCRNEWIPLGELPYKIDRFCTEGVLVHGRLHWLTVQNKGKSNPFPNIISIDLMDYSVKEVPMPTEVIFRKSKRSQHVDLGGCLSVGVRRNDSRMHIWVMKTYGMESSWVKQYVFGSEFLKFDRKFWCLREEMLLIVCLLNNEEILIS